MILDDIYDDDGLFNLFSRHSRIYELVQQQSKTHRALIMISSEMKNPKLNPKKNVKAFVRKSDAPLLPAPPSEVGLKGWLYQHVFQSMSDFSSLSASIKSILIAIFTVFVFYSFASQIYGFVEKTPPSAYVPIP